MTYWIQPLDNVVLANWKRLLRIKCATNKLEAFSFTDITPMLLSRVFYQKLTLKLKLKLKLLQRT
jgi:hypothetical protein